MQLDFLLDSNFDIRIEGGDFVIGEATLQNQKILLLAEKGSIRSDPTRGVGLASWLLDDEAGNLNGAVKREFEADGMTVASVRGVGANLQINAAYD